LGLTGVVEMAVGARSSCARKDVGSVFCWGDAESLAPTEVEGLRNVVAMSASQAESRCFAVQGGPVMRSNYGGRALRPVEGLADVVELTPCWPSSVCGLHPDGTVTCVAERSPDALAGADSSGLRGVTQIAATMTQACALTSDRKVRCWGENKHGELDVLSK